MTRRWLIVENQIENNLQDHKKIAPEHETWLLKDQASPFLLLYQKNMFKCSSGSLGLSMH